MTLADRRDSTLKWTTDRELPPLALVFVALALVVAPVGANSCTTLRIVVHETIRRYTSGIEHLQEFEEPECLVARGRRSTTRGDPNRVLAATKVSLDEADIAIRHGRIGVVVV